MRRKKRPYPTIKSLPNTTKVLPMHAKRIWQKSFNSALKQYGAESSARRIAWSAVKTQYRKDLKDNVWIKKS